MVRELRSRTVRSSSVTDAPSSSLIDPPSSPLTDPPSSPDLGNPGSFSRISVFPENEDRDSRRRPSPSDHVDEAASDADVENAVNDQAVAIIHRIEHLVEDVVDALLENRPMTIPMRSRRSGNEALVGFPTGRSTGGKKFTALLQILSLCREALVSGVIITKRDIYYRNPSLFGSQRYVDELVDDIAFTFEVSRDALNIVAATKGLIAGSSFDSGLDNHVYISTSLIITGADFGQGVAIPQTSYLDGLDLRLTRWILIIEKEATFRSLAASRYFESSAAGPGILVTAKGYPDLATRQFLRVVHTNYPQIPMHALVDFDPDGINIMRTYKNGSRGLDHVAIPNLSWLGVKGNDGIRSRTGGMEKTLSLTLKDRRMAARILESLEDQHDQDAEQMELTREVQMMLVLNVKFETQAVDDVGRMAAWLDEKLAIVDDVA